VPLALEPGARLRFPTRRRGARVVVAIDGGFVSSRPLGSAATDLEAGLGGWPGRLPAGARLHAGPSTQRAPRLPPDALVALASVYDGDGPLRFVPSPDCPRATLDALAGVRLRVSPRSNRSGFRLRPAARVPSWTAASARSTPLAPHAIQLPPDGEPILLMADQQTIGGYPLLGHLAAADAPRAAQLWPGDELTLTPVSLEAARAAVSVQRASLTRLAAADEPA
jgi:allophanate hydrolase subunit 2